MSVKLQCNMLCSFVYQYRIQCGQNYHKLSFRDILLKAHAVEKIVPILEGLPAKKISRKLE